MPVISEEDVTEKRVVAMEQMVLDKATVTENQSIDATIRMARREVDRPKTNVRVEGRGPGRPAQLLGPSAAGVREPAAPFHLLSRRYFR